MATELHPMFEHPPDRHGLLQLVESIEGLLAEYVRRSILRGEGTVPLDTVIRDLRRLVESASA